MTIKEIDATILIASQNGKIAITNLIVNMIRTMIGNGGEIEMGGERRTNGRVVDGLARREIRVRGKIDDKSVYILEGMGFANAVNIKNTCYHGIEFSKTKFTCPPNYPMLPPQLQITRVFASHHPLALLIIRS
jgi:hypothetical protein